MKSPEDIKRGFTELCTACGLCTFMCPPFAHRSVTDTNQEVQQQVRGFISGDAPTEAVLERSRLCNECYKCLADICPQGLKPMRANLLMRGMLHEQDVLPRLFVPPSDPQSLERIAAALLTTEDEYRRITTPVVRGKGTTLFFPGCNIYYQPNLLLTALDVLEFLVEDWIFLPGFDRCCGSNHDSAGRLDAGRECLDVLAFEFDSSGAQKIAVWCSTCAARLHPDRTSTPVISFSRLIADHLAGHVLGETIQAGLTLQEPCKDAYLGVDTGQRKLLEKISGEPVREMSRHGRDTVCCGWALQEHRPVAWEQELKERLEEARAAGARTMATVCHGCQWVMDRPGIVSDIRIVNYIQLVGEALGISHPERFAALREIGSVDAALDSIRSEMGSRFDQLPFEESRIRETVETLVAGFYGF